MIVKTQYVEFNELSVKLYTVLITMCHHSVAMPGWYFFVAHF